MPCILMMYATSAFEPDLPALLCSPLVCAHNTYPLLLSMKQTSDLYKSCTYYTQWLITSPAASMTMAARNFNTAITLAGFCLSFLSLITANSTESSCSGPIQYYLDVGCTPVFKSPGDPCPEKYNCDHLKNLPTDKCVVNGHEYAIGESLREEDSNPCDIGCFCSQGYGNGGPTFTCAIVDCFFGPTKPGCYRQHSATSCCSGPEVCPEKPEDVPTCTVDGKVYKDGEYFAVPSEPNKSCYCGPGYTGENVEPFCYEPKRSYCSPLFRHASDVRQNCVPTYYQNQSPKTSCSVAYRCQNNNDVVIARSTNSSEETKSATSDSAMKCTFGNLTMNVGDELNQATDYSSVCVKCVCEVPPIPTCQRLPDEECDVTEHPNFSSS